MAIQRAGSRGSARLNVESKIPLPRQRDLGQAEAAQHRGELFAADRQPPRAAESGLTCGVSDLGIEERLHVSSADETDAG